MFAKSICLLLTVLFALTAAETASKLAQRQAFPEQFSQFSDKFQEAFVNPSGGNAPQLPFGQMPNGFPTGQMPSGFPAPPGIPFSRRQLGDIGSTIKDHVPFPMGSRHVYNY